jgi:PTH1 family peptidyl-tRNA hydrolase
MWMIAGLGNPGDRYKNTRHNVGFHVIDQLAGDFRILLRQYKNRCAGKGGIAGHEVILLKPLTFMNLSGIVIRKILNDSILHTGHLIVVHDDLDIEPGLIKIRRSGSSGGHRGIESIMQELGTREFIRVKIGIGRPDNIPSEEYVLSTFPSSERAVIKEAITKASQAITLILSHGVEQSMTEFNRTKR